MEINSLDCAREIVKCVGGAENVQSITHCMTRLRFILADDSKVDLEAVKKVPGVLGCVIAGGQTQVILGKNLLPVFDEVQKLGHFSVATMDGEEAAASCAPKGPRTIKGTASAVLNYVSASMTPI